MLIMCPDDLIEVKKVVYTCNIYYFWSIIFKRTSNNIEKDNLLYYV